MENVCFNIRLVLFHQRTFELLKAVFHCIPGSESGISSASFLAEASTWQSHNNCVIFVTEKKKNNPNVSCFIFKLVALWGPILDKVDFKTFMVLFLLLGLCFHCLENKGEAKERCCL